MEAQSSLNGFVRDLSELLAKNPSQEKIFAEGAVLVKELISSPDFTRDLLEHLALDAGFAADFFPAIDPNDITLYRDPEGAFSIRLFIWESNTPYPPHDHGSWGIVGGLAGRTRELKYRRLDKGDKPGYSELTISSESVLLPGQITFVLPIDEGIHSMSPYEDSTSISLHVYGRAIRKGFIQGYHPATNQVFRIYSPKQLHRVTALHALGAIDRDWARDILSTLSQDSSPLIREEALLARKTNP
ncbi:MAG: cysteine dioxygenase family protein [Firmicutes bacterium]|nr:cysteine dioxygenase family protein [Bacillota bacterium]